MRKKFISNKIMLLLSCVIGGSFAEELYYGQEATQTQQQAQQVNTPPVGSMNGLPVPDSYRRQVENKAFEQAQKKAVGMNAQQIRTVKEAYAQKLKALEDPVLEEPTANPPKNINVSLEAKGQRRVLTLHPNNATTLMVVDAGGNPWEIENISVGNQANVSVSRPDENGNIFTLSTDKTYKTRSNIVLFVKYNNGAKERIVPISFEVLTGQDNVDDIVTVHIQAYGPNAKVDVGSSYLPPAMSADYNTWFTSVPKNIKKLKSSLKGSQVYQDQDGTFVLITDSNFSPLSPSIVSSIDSPDGSRTLYKFTQRAPIIKLKDRNANIQTIRVTGY